MTPAPDAICERLREGILVFGPKDCGCPMVDVVTANQAMRKAADLIQQQLATIERLSAELERAGRVGDVVRLGQDAK